MRTASPRSAFTLIELIAVVTVIGILMALLLPAIQAIRANGRSVACQNNLSQIGKALNAMLTKTDLPGILSDKSTGNVSVSNWTSAVLPYLGGQESVLTCPELGGSGATGYGINNLANLFGANDSRKILILDFVNKVATVVGSELSDDDRGKNWDLGKAPRHGGLVNILYFDGHVNSHDEEFIDPVSREIHDYWWLPAHRKQEFLASVADIPGLWGEYRVGSRNWSGPPDVERLEPDLNLPFGGGLGGSYGDMKKHPFYDRRSSGDVYYGDVHTALLRGQIRPDVSENYYIRVGADDQCYITLDGTEIVHLDTWTGYPSGSGAQFGPFAMDSHKWIDIEIRHNNPIRNGTYLWVKWSSPSTPEQMIPSRNLRLKPK